MDPIVLKIAIARPLDKFFYYSVSAEKSEELCIGSWVKVQFGKSTAYGFILEIMGKASEVKLDFPPEKLKNIIELGPKEQALSQSVLKLCEWTSQYYCTPLGEVCQTASPLSTLGLKTAKKEAREIKPKEFHRIHKTLTEEQINCVENIFKKQNENPQNITLLKGITGSGKTEVYFEIARKILNEGKTVLFLVPEIALTSQLVNRIEAGLGERVVDWHSGVSSGKRRDQTAALRKGLFRVVVGARSSIFSPLPNLGLIIVDEEHDPTYKQDDKVRYNARDLSILRGKIENVPVILGSATPSLESLERCREGKYFYTELKSRFSHHGLPDIELVSLKDEICVEGIQAKLTEKALNEIKETLSRDEQVMIFLNRRGFSQFLLCEDCGEVEECPNCSISLTYHFQKKKLKCHICNFEENVPDFCPKCNSLNLTKMGAGTESLEEELPRLLQDVKILRLDRDTVTSSTRLDQILSDFREKKAQILVGTQMLVKGHDFPEVTLVIVLFADGLFRIPDFRANERSYQTLLQVSGRSGRGNKKGKVLIQTYEPDHPIFKVLKGETSEEDFLKEEKEMREVLSYPPFSRMARLRIESSDQKIAIAQSNALKENFDKFNETFLTHLAPKKNENSVDPFFEALGPSEAFLEKAKGIYRWDILVKSKSISKLHSFIMTAKKWAHENEVTLLVDVDPYGV